MCADNAKKKYNTVKSLLSLLIWVNIYDQQKNLFWVEEHSSAVYASNKLQSKLALQNSDFFLYMYEKRILFKIELLRIWYFFFEYLYLKNRCERDKAEWWGNVIEKLILRLIKHVLWYNLDFFSKLMRHVSHICTQVIWSKNWVSFFICQNLIKILAYLCNFMSKSNYYLIKNNLEMQLETFTHRHTLKK